MPATIQTGPVRIAPTSGNDRAALQAFRDGDERALEAVVERNWSACYRVARAVAGDAATAEDAAQEALVELVIAARSARLPDDVGAWLRGAAANRARMHVRAGRRRDQREQRAARREEARAEDDPAASLRELTAALPDKLRVPLELHFGLGCTHAEVGALVGCATGTAASRIRIGVERVREGLAGRGPALAGSALLALLSLSASASAAEPAPPSASDLARCPAPLVPGSRLRLAEAARRVAPVTVTALAITLAAIGLGALVADSPDPRIARAQAVAQQVAAAPVARPDEGTREPDASGPGSVDVAPRAAVAPIASRDPLPATQLAAGQIWQQAAELSERPVAFSPDGRHAVTASVYGVRVWEVDGARVLAEHPGWSLAPHRSRRRASPIVHCEAVGFVDPTTCLVRVDHLLVAMHIPDGVVTRTWEQGEHPEHLGPVLGDGRSVLALWPLGTWDTISGALELHPGLDDEACAFLSPDGSRLALLRTTEKDGATVTLARRTSTGWSPLWVRHVSLDSSSGRLAFAHDGRALLLTDPWRYEEGGLSPRLFELDAASGETRSAVAMDAARCIATSPGGHVALGGQRAITVRDPDGTTRTLDLGGSYDERGVAYVGILPDGRTLASVGSDDRVRLWDLASGAERVEDDAHAPIALAVSPDDRVAAAHRDGGLSVRDGARGAVQGITRLEGRALAVAWSADGATVNAVLPAGLEVIDPAARRSTRRALTGGSPVVAAAFSADGRRLAVACTERVRVLALPGLGEVACLGSATAVALSPDGRRVARFAYDPAQRAAPLAVLDLETGEQVGLPLPTRPAFADYPPRLAFATAGLLIVSDLDGVSAWDTSSRERRWHQAVDVCSLAITPDGATVLVGTSGDGQGEEGRNDRFSDHGRVLLVDALTGVLRARLVGKPYHDMASLAPSRDGTALFGGTHYSQQTPCGAVLRWDLR